MSKIEYVQNNNKHFITALYNSFIHFSLQTPIWGTRSTVAKSPLNRWPESIAVGNTTSHTIFEEKNKFISIYTTVAFKYAIRRNIRMNKNLDITSEIVLRLIWIIKRMSWSSLKSVKLRVQPTYTTYFVHRSDEGLAMGTLSSSKLRNNVWECTA